MKKGKLLLWMVFSCVGISTALSAQAKDAIPVEVQKDVQQLEGVWVRPDGGYILKLSDIGPDGGLTAAYYNPQSINVARAEWRLLEKGLAVFVELQDVNYPGSTYALILDPVTDRLKGIYFQALQQQSYLIEFFRDR